MTHKENAAAASCSPAPVGRIEGLEFTAVERAINAFLGSSSAMLGMSR